MIGDGIIYLTYFAPAERPKRQACISMFFWPAAVQALGDHGLRSLNDFEKGTENCSKPKTKYRKPSNCSDNLQYPEYRTKPFQKIRESTCGSLAHHVVHCRLMAVPSLLSKTAAYGRSRRYRTDLKVDVSQVQCERSTSW